MHIKEIFDGVYIIDNKLSTLNLVKGEKVYGEDLVNIEGKEYRLWNPNRSKLAAALSLGLKNFYIKKGSKVLYLGAATGTTCSHISDIVGREGIVFCVEISSIAMLKLVELCKKRENMIPILSDARITKNYDYVNNVDFIYEDVAARDQAAILKENAKMLKKGGYAYVAIKSQSISIVKQPREVYNEFIREVSDTFKLVEMIDISKFHKAHAFVVLKRL